ncbi:MAG: hypothetical protein VX640_13925 [Pseudomonadota bacterium]|nr:hypothetical protein [Pseudomonadota bacterium]
MTGMEVFPEEAGRTHDQQRRLVENEPFEQAQEYSDAVVPMHQTVNIKAFIDERPFEARHQHGQLCAQSHVEVARIEDVAISEKRPRRRRFTRAGEDSASPMHETGVMRAPKINGVPFAVGELAAAHGETGDIVSGFLEGEHAPPDGRILLVVSKEGDCRHKNA